MFGTQTQWLSVSMRRHFHTLKVECMKKMDSGFKSGNAGRNTGCPTKGRWTYTVPAWKLTYWRRSTELVARPVVGTCIRPIIGNDLKAGFLLSIYLTWYAASTRPRVANPCASRSTAALPLYRVVLCVSCVRRSCW